MRQIHSNGSAAPPVSDSSTVRLVAQAHRYWRTLRSKRLNLSELATRERVSPLYMTRVLRLAFLSPAVTTAILAGRQRAGVDGVRLIGSDSLPTEWNEQAVAFLPN